MLTIVSLVIITILTLTAINYLLKAIRSPQNSTASDGTLLNKYNINHETSQTIGKPAAPSGNSEWINDRKQREAHMKAQRQQMVLNARRRTLELMNQQQQTNATI